MTTLEQLNALIDLQKTRYFRFQKFVFLSELRNKLDQEGIKSYLLTDEYRNQKYHSLVVGDLKTAVKVTISHYDTPSLIHDYFNFKPFDVNKRQRVGMIIEGIKAILIVILASYPLFIMIQDIMLGYNVYLFGVMSLILFLVSLLLIRLPIFLPSVRNENKDTLKYMVKLILEKEPNTSYVFVDDGMNYQMGYQILSKNLKHLKRDMSIIIYDNVINNTPTEYKSDDLSDTILRFFDSKYTSLMR